MLSDLGCSHHLSQNAADGAVEARPAAQEPLKTSYANSWEWYINGNVVSDVSRRYIVSLLGCTTARALDTPDDDETDNSDDDGDPDNPQPVGNMDLVQRTIDGMWSSSEDDGILGFGRYSESIRLGRNLWQSPAIPEDAQAAIREDVMDPTAYPSGKDLKKDMLRLQKAEEGRPAPFQGRTEPYASLTVHAYGRRIANWFEEIREVYTTWTMQPGALGAVIDGTTGKIDEVASGGQFEKKKIHKDWHVRDINKMPYTSQLLAQFRGGSYEYSMRIEKHVPTKEQMLVLEKVRDRVLLEFRRWKESDMVKGLPYEERQKLEDPLRGLVHGLPGTGKSKVIQFIRRFFVEALGWEYGVDFIFVAFQNRVAYAMGGETIHTAANLEVGNRPRVSHTDVDVLTTRNRDLKFVLVDEVGMISDLLLGAFETSLSDATSREKYFKMLDDDIQRLFGGYNVLMFGDFSQLTPLPPGGPIFAPPSDTSETGSKQERARGIKDLFWSKEVGALNYFAELVETKRFDDAWYAAVLNECRAGALSDESYAFLHGLPTNNPGSWCPGSHAPSCGDLRCANLAEEWRGLGRGSNASLDGPVEGRPRDLLPFDQWEEHAKQECGACQTERERRCRLFTPQDAECQQDVFLEAPYVHQNNEPKYHALLLRAQEYAKRRQIHCLWFQAVDRICNTAEIPKDPQKLKAKRERFLQFHDQKTAGMPGLCPLYRGLKMRTTEKIRKSKAIVVLKHTPCTVVGWRLHELDQLKVATSAGARFLDYLPDVIFVQFADVVWQLKGLEPGVLPIFPEEHEWTINKETDSKAIRRGFKLLPDFACTAFMVQGTSLLAALADCGDVSDFISTQWIKKYRR